MADSVAQRFERKVDRTADHHLWLGARKENGTGVMKVGGRMLTAHRVAWELIHGELPPKARVFSCPDVPACVRLDHLRVEGAGSDAAAEVLPVGKGRRGRGTMRQARPGTWELAVPAGRYSDGTPRRLWRTVKASGPSEAARALTSFLTEVADTSGTPDRGLRDITVDGAVEMYLAEHLLGEKGREQSTVDGYRKLHRKWFSPHIGGRRLVEIDQATMDRIFGDMRRAGLSRSRMNQAKCLYGPLFKWAKRRKIVISNAMTDFQLPTSSQVSRERTPPEVEELSTLLSEAVRVVPEIAPLLVLGSVTGMRRGELVGLRRHRIDIRRLEIIVDTASDQGGRVKATKTRRRRTVQIDGATAAMLERHMASMDDRAEVCGVVVARDAFVFSEAPDCSVAWVPDTVTKRVAVLKEHLGIADKRPETIAREDAALALFKGERPKRRAGRPGGTAKGGLSYAEIARRFDRTEMWALHAIRSAERREAADARGLNLNFDGSILALRKFTSTELLDAGFNLSMVAERQGHGTQVLVKHYSRARRSADRKAAEHLGRVVHGENSPGSP